MTDDERVEQIPTGGLQMEISWDERFEQPVNEESARSLNSFRQLLDTIFSEKNAINLGVQSP